MITIMVLPNCSNLDFNEKWMELMFCVIFQARSNIIPAGFTFSLFYKDYKSAMIRVTIGSLQ